MRKFTAPQIVLEPGAPLDLQRLRACEKGCGIIWYRDYPAAVVTAVRWVFAMILLALNCTVGALFRAIGPAVITGVVAVVVMSFASRYIPHVQVTWK
jgi:hypothetical protein